MHDVGRPEWIQFEFSSVSFELEPLRMRVVSLHECRGRCRWDDAGPRRRRTQTAILTVSILECISRTGGHNDDKDRTLSFGGAFSRMPRSSNANVQILSSPLQFYFPLCQCQTLKFTFPNSRHRFRASMCKCC